MKRSAPAKAGPARAPAELGAPLEFMVTLLRLGHALERASVRMQGDLGVTARQRMVLLCLARRPELAGRELAELLDVDAATFSLTVKRLEAAELVVRRRDPGDRRKLIMALTPAGRAIVRKSSNTVEAAVARFLKTVPASTSSRARAVIESLVAALDADAAENDASA
ncbi:MAG: MarR family transcriptional regulator [Polyangiaceae bacterium]